MKELTSGIEVVVQKYMRDPTARITSSTTLSDLEIDLLDLPMIFLDIEDAFDVQVEYGDDVETIETVQDLVTCVAACLAAKALQPHPRSSVPRSKRSWLSTAA
ncbi:MAG: acyl carrier protein [Hyphomicrobium sp.]